MHKKEKRIKKTEKNSFCSIRENTMDQEIVTREMKKKKTNEKFCKI